MNLVEKRDFIHNHLHRADERIIDEFYETLRKSNILKDRLESRAEKAEDDIRSGRVFSRTEIEQRTASLGR
ncbi:MAG: hypothetical protein RBT74_13105 [Tenuifilaceae bacterium]|nr:hypothetical protein [Tenuifilaceae bacterium]